MNVYMKVWVISQPQCLVTVKETYQLNMYVAKWV